MGGTLTSGLVLFVAAAQLMASGGVMVRQHLALAKQARRNFVRPLTWLNQPTRSHVPFYFNFEPVKNIDSATIIVDNLLTERHPAVARLAFAVLLRLASRQQRDVDV